MLEIVPIRDLGRDRIRRMREYLKSLCYSVSPFVEMEGDDGGYFDLTGGVKDFLEAEAKAHEMRLRMKHDTGLTTSVGISFNRNFAKLGSDLRKPFQCSVINHHNWRDIVWPLPTRDLYWIGHATERKLSQMLIHSIGQLAVCDLNRIFSRLGVIGRMLWHFANGQDTTPISFIDDVPEEKTVGNSATALEDMHTLDSILEYAAKLCEVVSERLRENDFMANGIKGELRSANDLSWLGRQKPLPFPSRTSRLLFDQANVLIQRHWDGKPLRGLGIRTYKLVDDDYLQMAILPEMLRDQSRERIDFAKQEIHRRMGDNILIPGRVFMNPALARYDITSDESSQSNAFRRS